MVKVLKKGVGGIQFDFGTTQNKINAAENAVRWNPFLAITWMKEALTVIQNPIELSIWNKAAHKINKTLDNIESQRYYARIAKEFWVNEHGIPIPSRRLELEEENISLEDYKAMTKVLGGISS
jgi:hypothetical protein